MDAYEGDDFIKDYSKGESSDIVVKSLINPIKTVFYECGDFMDELSNLLSTHSVLVLYLNDDKNSFNFRSNPMTGERGEQLSLIKADVVCRPYVGHEAVNSGLL